MTKHEELELTKALMELHHAPSGNEHIDEAFRIIQDLLNSEPNAKECDTTTAK